MLSTIETLYQVLGVRQKIQNRDLRILYLREVWGLEQMDIAAVEGMGQSTVSKFLKTHNVSDTDIRNTAVVDYSIEEIKFLHKLPRGILNDAQLIAFVNNILGLNIHHPFYSSPSMTENIRISALHDLGIRQKQLVRIFGKTQPAISMIIKRTIERTRDVESPLREDVDSSVFKLEPVPPKQSIKFLLAGGIR